jgi:hypothetical protein
MSIKVTVKKNPPNKIEVYDRFLDGEDRKKLSRKIAELMVKKGDKDEDIRE